MTWIPGFFAARQSFLLRNSLLVCPIRFHQSAQSNYPDSHIAKSSSSMQPYREHAKGNFAKGNFVNSPSTFLLLARCWIVTSTHLYNQGFDQIHQVLRILCSFLTAQHCIYSIWWWVYGKPPSPCFLTWLMKIRHHPIIANGLMTPSNHY